MSRSEKKTKKKKKGCNPLIAILILGASFIVCLVVALFVGKGMLKKWVQGPDFQELVRKQSAEKLNADVRIDDVQWDGWSATVGKITSKGYKDAAFSKMDLHGIRTDFPDRIQLAFRRNGNHFGAAHFGQLHSCGTNATRCAGHDYSFCTNRGTVKHTLCC